MLFAQNITKTYDTVNVLKGVSLTIEQGQMVSIVGSSGAGKSTLLHILGTLDKPDSGEVFFQDKNLNKLNAKQLAAFRNQHIGFVFQFHHLLPEFSAWENVCIPGWIANKKKAVVKTKAFELLEQLGVKHRAENKPNQLSGGEQQRVAVARALINNPAIVFADEPTGNLDSKNAQEMHQLFVELNKRFNQTFVIVTHNLELAQKSHSIITMKDGLIT